MHVSPPLTINAQDHSIKSVTVFKSSKAEIVRHFSLDLATAQNKVEIHGLPSTLDTHSVRVSNLPAGVRLFDVVCTIGTSKDASYARDSPSERVRLLKVKRQALESERRVREHEADLLVNYAKTLTGEHVAPEKMSNFLESFVQQGRKNLQAITELSEKIVDIDRQIEKEAEQSAQKKGEARGEVSIVLGADAPTSIDLRLTYIVSSVSWRPTYELHALTDPGTGKPSPTLSLHYRALVTQSTGEDWAGTLLTLSTMFSDTTARRIPQLKPVKLLPRPAFHHSAFNNRGAVGIFGNNNNNNNNAGRQAGGLFGQPAMGGAGGLFGQRGAAFGQAQQQVQPQHNPTTAVAGCAPQAQAPVFGAPSVPAPRATGFSAFGAPASAATTSTTAPAQSQSQSQSAFGGFGSAPATSVAVSSDTFGSGSGAADDGFEEIAVPGSDSGLAAGDGAGGGAGAEPTTFVHETPVAISFSIGGKTSIPSDAAEHQVEVAVCEFAGVVSYVCVPRLDARVYLQCEVKNTSEYRLLAGPVSVILDDSYVSKTSIQDVSTNDTFTCTLGTDPATLVSYTRASRTAKDEGRGAFAEPRNTTTCTTTITLRNKHAFGLEEVLVRDVVPTCDDKLPRARVVLRKPAGLADAKDGESVSVSVDVSASAGEGTAGKATVQWEKGDGARGGGEKEGMFAWRAGVGAGEKVVLEAQWEVKAPADTCWVEGFAQS